MIYVTLVELPTKEESNLLKPFTREELAKHKSFPVPKKFFRRSRDLPANEYLLTCTTYTHKTLEQLVEAINRIRGRARF